MLDFDRYAGVVIGWENYFEAGYAKPNADTFKPDADTPCAYRKPHPR